MRAFLYVASATIALLSTPASAAIFDFTITNVGGQNHGDYSFSLDDSLVPNTILNGSARYGTPAIPISYSNVPGVGSGSINSGVTFFNPLNQGGLQIGFLPFGNFRLINTAIVENTSFSPQDLPRFKTGTFALSTTPQNSGPRPFDNYSITIAAPVGGIPEPSTWAMMLIGFAGVGAAMRRRSKVIARVAFT